MYKYTSFSQYSLTNLLNDELYMNHYESFNDPFECCNEIFAGFPKKESNSSRLKDIIQAWGFEDGEDSSALENYEDLVLSLEDTEPNVEGTLNSARISCFSKKQDNLLMWAHYADGLRGFCLEFDRETILTNNSSAQIFEVLYENKPAIVDTAVIAVLNDQVDYHEDAIYETEKRLEYAQMSDEQKESTRGEILMYKEYLDLVYTKNRVIYQKMLATKSIEWHYEEELRIILQTDNINKEGFFFKYPIKAIKSIIVGEKMPPIQKQTLFRLIRMKSKDIKLKIASRIPGQFSVKIDEVSE